MKNKNINEEDGLLEKINYFSEEHPILYELLTLLITMPIGIFLGIWIANLTTGLFGI